MSLVGKYKRYTTRHGATALVAQEARETRVTSHAICPRNAVGWTHVWGEGKQVRITDGQAYVLVMLGMIRYSPDDGPNARVYRLCEGVSIDAVERSLA